VESVRKPDESQRQDRRGEVIGNSLGGDANRRDDVRT